MPYWFPSNSYAELATNDVLNNVLNKYQEAASSWANTIQGYAEYFFSALAVMGFVWQLSQAWFHRSSFAEVIGEIIRYITFCGVFLWLLREGPNLAESIINALRQIGNEASGQPGLNPSGIVDLGFSVFDKACVLLKSDLSIDHVLVFILALIVLIIIALIGVNMLLQLCSAWVLAYAGVIFLGFGGSYWTKDMAVNYFKTVLGIGASLMTMTLLIGIGQSIIQEGVTQMSNGGEILGSEMGVLLVTSITLFMLVDKLPALVAGIINGASVGSTGIGAFGAGAAIGTAAAAMGMAVTSIVKSASIIAGAVKGGAGLATGFQAVKNEMMGEQADIASKMQEHRKEAGLPPESGFVKPPSATAVLGRMAQMGGAMMKQGIKNKASEAVSNTAGGKIADMLKKD